MQFLSILLLILQNWKYVAQFAQIVDTNVKKGMKEKDLELGLKRLEKGFADVTTIKETADAAAAINDSFGQ